MYFAAKPTHFATASEALQIALLPLLIVSLICAHPAVLHAQVSGTAIVFYGERQIHEEMWTSVFETVHEDLAAGLGEASLDRNPAMLRSEDIYPGIDFTSIIEVKLLGRCDVVPQADHRLTDGALGWVEMTSGQMRPFVFIDCGQLARVLGPATLGLSKPARERAMSQAIAHVLIHEWTHYATQRAAHDRRGIMQSRLSVAELMSQPTVGSDGVSHGEPLLWPGSQKAQP